MPWPSVNTLVVGIRSLDALDMWLAREIVTTCTVVALDKLDSGVKRPDSGTLGADGSEMLEPVASDVSGRMTETLVITVVVTTTGEGPVIDVAFRLGVLSVYMTTTSELTIVSVPSSLLVGAKAIFVTGTEDESAPEMVMTVIADDAGDTDTDNGTAELGVIAEEPD